MYAAFLHGCEESGVFLRLKYRLYACLRYRCRGPQRCHWLQQ